MKYLLLSFFSVLVFTMPLSVDAQLFNPSEIDRQNVVQKQTASGGVASGSLVSNIGVILRFVSGVLALIGFYLLSIHLWGYWLASNINTFLIAAEQGLLKSLMYFIVASILYALSSFLIG